MTPEHLHLALNHVPILGLGFAIIPLVLGFITRQRMALVAGLLIAMISGGITPIVIESGDHAAERYVKSPIAGYLDPQVGKYIEAHEKRVDAGSWAMVSAAALSMLCLAMVFWKPFFARWGGLLVVCLCVVSVFYGIWIADAGGKIRRQDFRLENTRS